MTKIGKYEVLDVLGKGAMGIVYRALDPDIDREVAIKAIHFDSVRNPAEREDLIRRFLREGRASGKLTNPNIVTIYDVGREGDLTFIVMQLIHGQSLQRLIDSGRTFSPLEVDSLMIPLLRAVDYAHANGVIHRDIKPGNILVDGAGVPYLADFGVAKTAAATLTMDAMALGTPGYISPEQLKGETADRRSDIFSLGVLFYVLLTGREPFSGNKISTVMHRIVNEEAPPPSRLKPDLPAGYDVIAGRAMAKDPRDRYQSCAEMAAAIESLDQAAAATVTLRLGASEAGRKERRPMVKAIWPAASFGIVILAAALSFFVLHPFGLGHSAARRDAVQPVQPPPAPNPGPSQAAPDPVTAKLATVRESFERGSFEETARLAREVLVLDPSRKEAQDYLDRSTSKLEEARLAGLLSTAHAAYDKRDYPQCLSTLADVFKADPNNAEAAKLREQAEADISKGAIASVIERQRRAEQDKDLLVLLDDIGAPEEASRRKDEAKLLFNNYSDIKSSITIESFAFPAKDRVLVTVFHTITGIYRNTHERRVPAQDKQTWSLEKQGTRWKITGFHAENAGQAA